MAKFRDAKHHPGKGGAEKPAAKKPGASQASEHLDAALADQVRDLKRYLQDLGRLRPLRDPIAEIDADLTPPQIHTILWLGGDGPLAANVLSQRLGSGQPTVTGVIDRLEKAGYVVRERGVDDRRVVLAKLTHKGEELHRLLETRVSKSLEMIMHLLDETDRADLIRIVKNLGDALRIRAASAAPASEES